MICLENAIELTNLIKNNNRVIVMFSTTWCQPCQSIRPLVEKYSNDYQDINFVYLNLEKFNDPDEKYTSLIKSFPTFHYYFNGYIKNMFSGANQSKLLEMIK